jgi:hypothetical protein
MHFLPLVTSRIYLPLWKLFLSVMCLKKTVLVINCWEMVGPGSVQPGYGSEDLDLCTIPCGSVTLGLFIIEKI